MRARKLAGERLVRVLRGWRFDRNPLRRATDRVETVVLTALVVAFLVAAPFAALAAGAWLHGMAQRAQAAQEASRFRVPAVVLTVAGSADNGSKLPYQAQARWQAPDGREMTGEVPVPSGAAAGATVQVWTDRTGALTTEPLQDSQVAEQTVIGEALGVIAAAGALAITGLLARRSLDKRRMAAWDADWRATGPRWTTRA